MQLKTGRYGKYFGCSNDNCGATRRLQRNGDPYPIFMDPIALEDLKCKKVDDYYLLRDSLKGLFLAASQFPKNRETRAPLVKEILDVVDQLPEKYSIFSSAITADPEGDDLVIRFNRKDGSHYLSSELNGKKKKWIYVYEDNSWKEMPRS